MSARNLGATLGIGLGLAVAACGGRPSYWDGTATSADAFGLTAGVVLVENATHRAMMLTALAGEQIETRSFRIGHNVTSEVISPDGNRLFILSNGDWPHRRKDDEYPSLTVIDASTVDPPPPARYTMSLPLPHLAIDPLGHWAVAYSGAGSSAAFVQNANELVIFDLTTPGAKPESRTIRSYGGTPQRLTFTPKLRLPKGDGRLLIIETDIDVTLLELGKSSPEVTVPLTSGKSAHQLKPAGVVVDPFNSPDPPFDARIALRVDDRNVFTLTLGPSDNGDDFTPIINVIDVGGVPSDIAFVHTGKDTTTGKAMLRVAALVPTTSSAVLVDPDTSSATQVPLPAPYANLSLVTNVVGNTTGTDVAMLWNANNGSGSGVAFWRLGNAVGQPYFSVESVPVSQPVESVEDVPKHENLRVLDTKDGLGFFVLDLLKRTASPLDTHLGRATLVIAPDGQRLWAYARGGNDLVKLDLDCTNASANCAVLNPVPVSTDAPIYAVFDVARRDGGRSLIAIHRQGTIGATVFDASNPDPATARRVPTLLLEGP